ANVACGFHAGDAATMLAVARRASKLGVVVGAHVSYRDREGFGRRELDVGAERLAAEVREQIRALEVCCREAGARVRYVKPHGALYNAAARERGVAEAVCAGVAAFGGLPVLALPGSELLRAADAAGFGGVAEGFADRGYRSDGSLVARGEPGALLEGAAAIAARALAFAGGEIADADGASLQLSVRSLCLHGDSPGAVAAATAVRAALERAGVRLEPFAA
ncbi:MAG TPA: 5-oxoprolinase subunit PxpA, partial [Solirubrobacteraceae bacterium]|nr:5-oxoprolinase subunit PxpA [Solirubrobacteraceae bacterium]